VLAERRAHFFGVVNGIDYAEWNPATDRHLAANYDAASVEQGKPLCKQSLQANCGIEANGQAPLLGVVARLVEQKGIELILNAAVPLLQEGTQLIVLGEGDPAYHRELLKLRDRFPERMSVKLAFDEPLAHQIEAGSDLFLMPSLYEPSGLNQLYSMRYGTLPVVRATGGLADTVVDCTPQALTERRATGFSFIPRTAEALLESVSRALTIFRDNPEQWQQLVQTAMRQDWSWDRSAGEYELLYDRVVAKEP
jgi:starch synthase